VIIQYEVSGHHVGSTLMAKHGLVSSGLGTAAAMFRTHDVPCKSFQNIAHFPRLTGLQSPIKPVLSRHPNGHVQILRPFGLQKAHLC